MYIRRVIKRKQKSYLSVYNFSKNVAVGIVNTYNYQCTIYWTIQYSYTDNWTTLFAEIFNVQSDSEKGSKIPTLKPKTVELPRYDSCAAWFIYTLLCSAPLVSPESRSLAFLGIVLIFNFIQYTNGSGKKQPSTGTRQAVVSLLYTHDFVVSV